MLRFYRTYQTPFREKIPVSLVDFLHQVPFYKRAKRFFGRYLFAEIALRKSTYVETITSKHQKILWIQWVDGYLGDSLMDLSSRILLKDKQIDLLTRENVAKIYQNDTIFQQIFSDPEAIDVKKYDLMIVDSYRQRGLSMVRRYFPNLPHSTLYGYYNVNDFNRLYYSFFRFNQLLSSPYSETEIQAMSKPLLPITQQDEAVIESLDLPDKFIAIALGGANEERTYHHWLEVVDGIFQAKMTDNIVLLGLQNAEKNAMEIIQKYPNLTHNLVGRCSFNQSAQIIKKSIMLVCCDGGLLHAANAVLTPIVALFYYIDPLVRLIEINPSIGLVGKDNINHIQPHKVVEKIQILKMSKKNGK
jgi:heptosyltransferase-2